MSGRAICDSYVCKISILTRFYVYFWNHAMASNNPAISQRSNHRVRTQIKELTSALLSKETPLAINDNTILLKIASNSVRWFLNSVRWFINSFRGWGGCQQANRPRHPLSHGSKTMVPYLGGWTSIYHLFWCSLGYQGFDPWPYREKLYEAWEVILQPAFFFSEG